MKILLINSLGPGYGSTVRSRMIFKALRGLGEDITYVESNCDFKDKNVISIDQENNVLSFFLASLQRARLCLIESYELYIICKITPLTVLAIFCLKLRRKRFIVDWDDLDSEFQSSEFRKKLTSFFERKIPSQVELITTHNNYLADYAKAKGARAVKILPQSIDTDIFDPGKYSPKEVTREKGLENKIVLSYLCTLTYGGTKDIDIVLKAFKEVSEDLEKVHLLLIGGGALEDELRAKIKKMGINQYTITGFISQDQVAKFLTISDICLVYMRDNIGNRMRVSFKTLEYLSMERKVVGTLIGLTKDALGEFCTLTDFNIKGLSRVIKETIRAGDFSAGQKAREFILENYSHQALMDKTKTILDSIKIDG